MKVDKLVKFHIVPKDNAAKAERLESWADVKAQIIAEPPKVETQATWHDATQSVGGFKRLVVQKVLRRKDLPKADPSQPDPIIEELRPDPIEEPHTSPSGAVTPTHSEEPAPARRVEVY
eukprot:EG_transcript_19794